MRTLERAEVERLVAKGRERRVRRLLVASTLAEEIAIALQDIDHGEPELPHYHRGPKGSRKRPSGRFKIIDVV